MSVPFCRWLKARRAAGDGGRGTAQEDRADAKPRRWRDDCSQERRGAARRSDASSRPAAATTSSTSDCSTPSNSGSAMDFFWMAWAAEGKAAARSEISRGRRFMGRDLTIPTGGKL